MTVTLSSLWPSLNVFFFKLIFCISFLASNIFRHKDTINFKSGEKWPKLIYVLSKSLIHSVSVGLELPLERVKKDRFQTGFMTAKWMLKNAVKVCSIQRKCVKYCESVLNTVKVCKILWGAKYWQIMTMQAYCWVSSSC